jgi:butyrate kinase
MSKEHLIFVINPGSTSTKVAVFSGKEELCKENIQHSVEDLQDFQNIIQQYPFRKKILLEWLEEKGYNLKNFSAIASRGGLLRPLPSGVYAINPSMVNDLKSCRFGSHASNLAAIIAYDLAQEYKIPAFIADPVTVDELHPIARFSGLKGIERKSIFHALNQKYIARKAAKDLGKKYDECNLIVVHLGGGISIGAHQKGLVVDVNNALNGEGPYSAERSGTLPTISLMKLCFSGKYSREEVVKLLAGKGGMVSHLGTNNAKEVEDRALEGEKEFSLIFEGMIYQTAKTIGEMSAVLWGRVDAIVLTGGMARSKYLCKSISDYTSYIAPLMVYPGEDEMAALAENAFAVIRRETLASCYYERPL